MGEKIRDIKSIKIGSCKFMVELNEGYFNEGRVIHVQNNKFRYLFNERQFYKLCANYMRSKSELDYLRMYRTSNSARLKEDSYCPADNKTVTELKSFLKLLKDRDIPYRVVDCKNKLATIIIDSGAYREYASVMKDNKQLLIKLNHPFGKMFGYSFLYQMKEFELIAYHGIYIEIFFQLPCMSLEKNTWIPLDKMIQKRIWENDTRGSFPHSIDNESFFIYMLCACIFQFGNFSNAQVKKLSQLYGKADKKCLEKLLNSIFFSYTKTLMSLLESEKYSTIINSYYSFKDY